MILKLCISNLTVHSILYITFVYQLQFSCCFTSIWPNNLEAKQKGQVCVEKKYIKIPILRGSCTGTTCYNMRFNEWQLWQVGKKSS